MPFSIYILYSSKSDRYYVGHSTDVEARLKDHNEGERPTQSTKYTFKHRPWSLVASFDVGETRGEAVKIEKYIKRQKSRAFIQKVIAVQDDPISLAQLVRVPNHRD